MQAGVGSERAGADLLPKGPSSARRRHPWQGDQHAFTLTSVWSPHAGTGHLHTNGIPQLSEFLLISTSSTIAPSYDVRMHLQMQQGV